MYGIITQIIQKQFPLSYGDGNAKPSSQSVAMWRAAHQLLEQPVVFSDDYAISILGETKENFSKNLESHKDPLSSAMRMSIAVRSRYAEDERASAIVQGAEQYVILGAGFDTYAYRSQFEHEKVFEVDLPQTQALKIQRLKQQGITPACCVDYVPCNFERGELEQNLIAAGFDKNKKSFFSCLGVVAYLDTAALQHTLQFIASCAAGSTLVFDYIVEPSTLNDIERMALGILAERLAEAGEPLKCFYHPSSLSQQLINLGFTNVRDVSPDDLNQRYLLDRQDGLKLGNVTRMFLASV